MSEQPESASVQMSLKTFRISAGEYRSRILKANDLISNAYQTFYTETVVGLHQCTTMMDAVREMRDWVRGFYKLLESPAHLPRSIIPLRYPLLIGLYQLDKQASEILWYIAAFRTQCLEAFSQEIPSLQGKILHQLEAILKGSEDIVENTNQLLDRAHFQEKQFIDLIQV